MSLPSLQTQLVIHCCFAVIDENRNKEDDNSNRGLDQLENAKFDYQTRDHDGVTYGCFGYVNEHGDMLTKHYFIDARGFRFVNTTDDDVVEVFPVATK
jgi:hypothetical protein